jgi:glutamate-5-semialdehyde dehydrogenase
LEAIASNLDRSRAAILQANHQDVVDAEAGGLSKPLLSRLLLDERKIDHIIAGVRNVALLPDPVGRRTGAIELDENLVLSRVTVPIGLIGVIFESRPDALVQIGSLCLKSGNAAILKGGSEALRSNILLHSVMKDSLDHTHDDFADALQLVHTREDISELLKLDQWVDLVIPRGSSDLVRHIMDNTRIPVLGHAEGVCHIYVDRGADIDMALDIVYDSKCQYPAVCNALETLLVHEELARTFLPDLQRRLEGVELKGDEKTGEVIRVTSARQEDWRKEYNDLVLSVKVVASADEAVAHINRFGSHHTDGIVTANPETAESFLRRVDSASVLWNCSTRFADGFRFGLGAEVGIATGKIHARGPVGLEGLTTHKYELRGGGHTVAPYAEGLKSFTHRKLGG